jgi:tetratricopeptide (TPR) repeat protein
MKMGPKTFLLSASLLLCQIAPAQGTSFNQRLAEARVQYFGDLEGNRGAADKARATFASLAKDFPGDPVVDAYTGSLELLDAARTWAVWDKRRLANEGLEKMDQAVQRAPDNLEARFIRAASTWHLPFLYKRRDQSASDFTFIAPRAEAAVKKGTLPPELGAAALDYYGQVLNDRSDNHAAKQAFEAAIRIDGTSPGGRDAQKRLRTE